MKSRAEQLDEMSEAILLATDRIRYYKQQDKMLQSEIKRLTRNERTHRLCTRGGMIEAFIKSFPGDCTNSTLFCAMFRIVVFNSFFSFAAWELIVYPPCNELGSLFITRAVFSKALLKTSAHFSCFVKLFLRFFKRKIPRTFFWYEVFFLSSYLNDIAFTGGVFAWWGKMDSNHRRHCQQIYSLSPLATREFPHMNLRLRKQGVLRWSWWTDSNPRPADYKSAALPAELHQRFRSARL